MLSIKEVSTLLPPLEEGAGLTLLNKEARLTLIKAINTLFNLDVEGRKSTKGEGKLTPEEGEILDLIRGDLFSYDEEGEPDPKEDYLLSATLTYFPEE